MRMPSKFVAPLLGGQAPRSAVRLKHILVKFVELQVPMALGALVCLLVLRLLPASPGFAAVYRPGTYLFAIGDTLFLAVPVIVWMILRGHRGQHCVGIAVSMLASLALIVGLGELSGYAYLPWLTVLGYPALRLGMLAYLLSVSSDEK